MESNQNMTSSIGLSAKIMVRFGLFGLLERWLNEANQENLLRCSGSHKISLKRSGPRRSG